MPNRIADLGHKYGVTFLTDEKLASIWSMLDVENKGFVTLDDLAARSANKQLGLGSSKHAYERLMRAADTNNNGQLSFDEFVVWARSREQHLRVFFHEADTSRSGGISAAELKAAFLKHDRMAVTDSRIASLMRKLDKDKDGEISFEELMEHALFLEGCHSTLAWSLFTGSAVFFNLDDAHKPPPFLEIFSAGLISGVISRTLTAPINRVGSVMRAGDAASNNPFKVAAHLIKTEGVRRLWVSNATVCLQVGPEMAANFFLYDRLKHALLADPNAPTRLEKFLVGGTAGWLAYSLTFPLLVAQFRLAVVPKGTYSGIIDLVRKTLQMEGVAGFFRGYTTASIRIFGIRGFDMLAFLALKNHFVKTDESVTLSQCMLFGSSAAVVSQSITAPLYAVLTRQAVQGASTGRPIVYHGMLDTIRKIVHGDVALSLKPEGIRGLYKGASSTVALFSAVTALQFAGFEKCAQFLKPYLSPTK